MQKEIRFTVSGRGEFPMDMLRYDECYPVGPDDVAAIRATFDMSDDAPRGPYEVRLLHRGEGQGYPKPTVARWNSFCWGVIDIDGKGPPVDDPRRDGLSRYR